MRRELKVKVPIKTQGVKVVKCFPLLLIVVGGGGLTSRSNGALEDADGVETSRLLLIFYAPRSIVLI